MRITDIAEALAPNATYKLIGIRPGEKVHEVLLTEDEARHATGFEDYYAIYPSFPFWRTEPYPKGDELPPGFRYSSDTNEEWLDAEQIRRMAEPIAVE
jgi:UDP-N-acetylglucosamine 4,6-dehydratase